MNRAERIFVLWTLGSIAVYVPVAIMVLNRNPEHAFRWLAPIHFLVMAQNVVALVLTIRDLYKRPFPRANDKVTWTLLIVCTGGVGWLVYVFRHAIKPRPELRTA